MLIKHPEILYALLLLLIPILVHLFQLRRFQKVPFTNVEFLKKITIQTRKSSEIKKWLTLFTRLLMLSGIIFAFSQPYTSNLSDYKTNKETVIYLDNSFSMQAKGESGPLLQRAVQDLIKNLESEEQVSIITNTKEFKNVSVNNIKNELIQLGYSTNQLDYKSAYLKAINSFSNDAGSLKNLIFISDFQEMTDLMEFDDSSDCNLDLVQLKPVNVNNVSVDSLFIEDKTASNLDLTVVLKNQGTQIEDLSVSLFNNNSLIAKSSLDISDSSQIKFTIKSNDFINGKVQISDSHLQFDNTLYFNIDKPEKVNVLSINGSDDNFLRRIYDKSEFNYKSTSLDVLDYSSLSTQNLVILNELKSIPPSLQAILKSFAETDGYVLIIPSIESDISTYNQLFRYFSPIRYELLKEVERRIFKINFSHPLFEDVFSSNITNFQYPKVNNLYPITTVNPSNIINYEDGTSFLISVKNLYVFSAPLNKENSNFQNSSLIVPTLYNMGKQSLKLSKPYYIIGEDNHIDINTSLNQDQVLVFENEDIKVIPQQKSFNNKVSITTVETPDIAGHYRINNSSEIIGYLSYNYDRDESNLNYFNLSNTDKINVSSSISKVLSNIKSNTKINELWKWFIIFALIMLIFEMLILKFYK